MGSCSSVHAKAFDSDRRKAVVLDQLLGERQRRPAPEPASETFQAAVTEDYGSSEPNSLAHYVNHASKNTDVSDRKRMRLSKDYESNNVLREGFSLETCAVSLTISPHQDHSAHHPTSPCPSFKDFASTQQHNNNNNNNNGSPFPSQHNPTSDAQTQLSQDYFATLACSSKVSSCCFSEACKTCCCGGTLNECARGSELPRAPPIFWDAIMSCPKICPDSSEHVYRHMFFQRFAVSLSLYCYYAPRFYEQLTSRAWYKQRQNIRTSLYYAEQLINETSNLFCSRKERKTHIATVSVLPSDVDMKDFLQWTHIEQGGIDGPSMIPLKYRGSLLTERHVSSVSSQTRERQFRVAYELEPLCSGLIWKRMLCSGTGWRRPGFRSLAVVRYMMLDVTKQNACLDQIETASASWNQLKLWLLDGATRGELCVPEPEQDLELFRTSVVEHFCETSPVFPLLLQTLLHALMVTVKTMTQGEICSLSSPWFNLMLRFPHSNFVLMLRLESWTFATPLGSSVKGREPISLLLLYCYNRTLHESTDRDGGNGDSLIQNNVSVDMKPNLDSNVEIEIQLCPVSNFPSRSPALPAVIQEALQYFTVQSSGYVWLSLKSLENFTLYTKLKQRNEPHPLDHNTKTHYVWVHVHLLSIQPTTARGMDASSTNIVNDDNTLHPVKQYFSAVQSLAKLDDDFYKESVVAIDTAINATPQAKVPAAAHVASGESKEMQEESTMCPDADAGEYQKDVETLAHVLDLTPVTLERCTAAPLFLLPKSPLIHAAANIIVNDMPLKSLTVWRCPSRYISKWTCYQTLCKHVAHDFFLQPYAPPLVLLGQNNWMSTSTLPYSFGVGSTQLVRKLANYTSGCDPWNAVVSPVLQVLMVYFSHCAALQPDVSGAVVRRILETPALPLRDHILLHTLPYALQWSLVDLPSTLFVWPLPSVDDLDSPASVLTTRMQFLLALPDKNAGTYMTPTSYGVSYAWDFTSHTLQSVQHGVCLENTQDACLEEIQRFLENILLQHHRHAVTDSPHDLFATLTTKGGPSPPSSQRNDVKMPRRWAPITDLYTLRFNQQRTAFVFTLRSPLHWVHPSWLMPCAPFLRALRHHLLELNPFLDDQHPFLAPSWDSSITFHADLFVKRWPGLCFFGPSMLIVYNLRIICSDLQEYFNRNLSLPVLIGLLYVCRTADTDTTGAVALCAPIAACVLVTHIVDTLEALTSRTMAVDDIITSLHYALLDLLKEPFSHVTSATHPFFCLFSICLCLLLQPLELHVEEDARLVMKWASRINPDSLIRYLKLHKDPIQFNGLNADTVMSLCALRHTFMRTILCNPIAVVSVFPSEHRGLLYESFVFSLLHSTGLSHACKEFTLRSLASSQTASFSIPVLHDMYRDLSILRWSISHDSVPISHVHYLCSRLTILVFRHIIAFNPWIGLVIPNEFSLGVLSTAASQSGKLCDVPPVASRPLSKECTDLFSCLKQFLHTLNPIILHGCLSAEGHSRVFLSPEIKVLLLVANGLVQLYSSFDLRACEKYFRETLSVAHELPAITLFCSSSLILLNYLRGKGQEETRDTCFYASVFRETRKLWPYTPLHIGLPDNCPEQLMASENALMPPLPYVMDMLQSPSMSHAFPSPNLDRHSRCKVVLAEVSYRGERSEKDRFHVEHNVDDDHSTSSLLAVHFMWNIATVTLPDLFVWFEAAVIRILLIQSELDVGFNSHDAFHCPKLPVTRHDAANDHQISDFQSAEPLPRATSFPLSSTSFPTTPTMSATYGHPTVFTLGNNAVAGALGVGQPRYLKHDEALYEIAPEFRTENAQSVSAGVDIWCAGNPVALFLHEEPACVAAGEHHTLLLTKHSNNLYVWGCNKHGQCGPTPPDAQRLHKRWTAGVITGNMVLTTDGHALHLLQHNVLLLLDDPLCFSHSLQKLESTVSSGNGGSTDMLSSAVYQPHKLDLSHLKRNDALAEVFAGSTYSAARTASGRLFLWGSLVDGCLARWRNAKPLPLNGKKIAYQFLDHHVKPSLRPLSDSIVKYFTSRLHRLRRVATGMLHVAAVDCYGGLWLWGQSEAGQLGFSLPFLATLRQQCGSLHSQAIFMPHRLRVFVCCLPRLQVVAWTKKKSHIINDNTFWREVRTCVKAFLENTRLTSCATELFESGHLTCRVVPQLNCILISVTDQALINWSNHDITRVLTPPPFTEEELHFKFVSCGEAHTLALGVLYKGNTKQEWLLAWGQGKYGQLGIYQASPRGSQQPSIHVAKLLNGMSCEECFIPEGDVKPTPCLVDWTRALHDAQSYQVQKVVSGGCSNAVLLDNGHVVVWGSNDFGALGFDELKFREIPAPRLATCLPFDFGAVSDVVFSMGGKRTFFLSKRGHVLCFGQDDSGSSGVSINKTSDIRFLVDQNRSPVHSANRIELPLNFHVSSLAAGVAHTVFVPTAHKMTTLASSSSICSLFNDSILNQIESSRLLPIAMPSEGQSYMTQRGSQRCNVAYDKRSSFLLNSQRILKLSRDVTTLGHTLITGLSFSLRAWYLTLQSQHPTYVCSHPVFTKEPDSHLLNLKYSRTVPLCPRERYRGPWCSCIHYPSLDLQNATPSMPLSIRTLPPLSQRLPSDLLPHFTSRLHDSNSSHIQPREDLSLYWNSYMPNNEDSPYLRYPATSFGSSDAATRVPESSRNVIIRWRDSSKDLSHYLTRRNESSPEYSVDSFSIHSTPIHLPPSNHPEDQVFLVSSTCLSFLSTPS